MPFCGHRWCGNEDCSEQAELLWDGYIKLLKYLIALPKSGQPQSKLFTILKDPFNDTLMKARFKFLEFLSNKLKISLRRYQTNQTMEPFLCSSFKEILKSLFQIFILNGRIKKASTTLKLIKIYKNDKKLRKPYDLIQIGTAAKLHVDNYRKSADLKKVPFEFFVKNSVCCLLL